MPDEATAGISEVWELLGALYPDSTPGFLEIRGIRNGEVRRRDFVALGGEEWGRRDLTLGGEVDLYFGVAPRTRKVGTKDAIAEVSAAWVDIDADDAASRLASFELPPSFVVSSGSPGHLHAYWPLTESAAPAEIECLNRALANRLGGDPAVVDASRTMRMPGTYNFKLNPPVVAKLIKRDERRFAAEEIWNAVGGRAEEAAPGGRTVTTSRRPAVDDANAPSPPVTAVLERLAGVTPSGGGWKALCPAHDDHQPSLQVDEGDDGRCLVHCFAACTPESIVAAIGLQMSDLFVDAAHGRRASSRLIHLVKASMDMFHTPDRAGHAVITIEDHRETWPIRSRGFELWLRRLHYQATDEALSEQALTEAIATLEAEAQFAGEEREVHRRVAGVGDRILIDLSDDRWRAIEITVDGWEVVEDPDVHFVRDPSSRPLPEPVGGSSIEELRPFANCADEASWMRLCGFLVMCFNPRGPYPVANPTGEQGSAKSTLSRLTVSLVDPRIAPLMMGTPSVRELAVNANSVWLVGFDNVSKVTPALSDALCQLATGGGYRTRQLYTDADPFILDLKRPVLLNAIGQVIERPDLLDRVALIELAPIPPEKRRSEEEFWTAWEAARPLVLGALLDGVVAAFGGAGGVWLEGFPRMADFARWGEAAGAKFGWPEGAFTAALEGSRQDLLEGSADAHPEIGVLLAFMDENEAWVGSASELLKLLTERADESVTGSRTWPKRPDTLSNRLTQHAPLLRTHGIEITRGREAGGNRKRFLSITRKRDAGTRGDA